MKGKALLSLAIVLVMVLAYVPYAAVKATSPVTISVVFPNALNTDTVKPGSNFIVSINISDATPITYYDLGIQWNPALLEIGWGTASYPYNNTADDVVQGTWMSTYGTTLFPGPSSVGTNLPAGYMSDIPCGFVSGGPATGSGTMFTIYFHCMAPGESAIGIMAPNVISYLLNVSSTLTYFSAVNGTVIQPYPISIDALFPETGTNTLTRVAGQAFNVSINIVNSTNIGFYELGVQWNPLVVAPLYSNVSLDVVQGTFMKPVNDTIFPGPAPADDETNVTAGYFGDIPCGFLTAGGYSNGSGTLFTVLFQCIAPGESAIGIMAPNVISYLLDPTLTQQVFFSGYNATVTQTAPPPAPTAIITSPTGVSLNLTSWTLGATVTLDGSHSLQGWNGTELVPITVWNWTVAMPNGTVTLTGMVVNITASIAGTWYITLTVFAPDPPGDSSYVNMSSATIEIFVIPPYPGAMIDVYTANGGQGILGAEPYPYGWSDSYGPQELVCVFANVTYNYAPVEDKPVEFVVYNNLGQEIASYTVFTNETGIAKVCFRIPWQGTSTFGIWSITGTVDVSQVQKTDTVKFYYGYQLVIQSVTIANSMSLERSNALIPYTGTMSVTVTIYSNEIHASLPAYLEITAVDNCSVPFGKAFTTFTDVPPGATASPAPATAPSETVHSTITIPEWAYVGPGTLYVDLLNSTATGVPYCPEMTAPFAITYVP